MARKPASRKKKKGAKRKPPERVCRTVRDPKTRKRKVRCTTRKAAARKPARKKVVRKPAAGTPATRPQATPRGAAPAPAAPTPWAAPTAAPSPQPAPAHSAAAPAPTVVAPPPPAPPVPPPPPVAPPAPGAIPVHDGPFGRREATRLLWRAGFGPRAGDAERLAGLGLEAAVRSLTRPVGEPRLTGPEPHAGGRPLAPEDVAGDEHAWWLDRMVRTDQPLVERMTLVWHDWFATSNADVANRRLMLQQNALLRRHALGSFRELTRDVTVDPAMLVFLSGIANRRGAPNENHARELLELFTLGAGRSAYTEEDVRELARALTGWTASNGPDGLYDFRFAASRHDAGTKTLWRGTPHERSGAFGARDAADLCVDHPAHAWFFVRKLWSAFVPTAPDDATQAGLEALYVSGGHQVRPVLEAILMHPDLYGGETMVKSPVVLLAGVLRAQGRGIQEPWWSRHQNAGQRLFFPPNVAGWNEQAWLDTSTYWARWGFLWETQRTERVLTPPPASETPEQALAAALAHLGDPVLRPATRAALLEFASAPLPPGVRPDDFRAQRQNALRHLVALSPDYQVS